MSEFSTFFFMQKILKNRLFRFLILSVAIYVAWQFIYAYIINPHTSLDHLVSINLAHSADVVLRLFGYDSTVDYLRLENFIIVRLQDSTMPGVRIGDPCNGVSLFGLFAAVILAFPSKQNQKINWKKLWFIPLGILLIHFLNVIRIAVLTVIASYNFEALNFNHDVTFKIVTYGFIFILWYVWINRFSGFKVKSSKKSPIDKDKGNSGVE